MFPFSQFPHPLPYLLIFDIRLEESFFLSFLHTRILARRRIHVEPSQPDITGQFYDDVYCIEGCYCEVSKAIRTPS